MNDENKTQRVVIYCLTSAFCVLVLTIGGCVSHGNDLTARAIQNGAAPINTVCAMSPSSIDAQICMAAALNASQRTAPAKRPNAELSRDEPRSGEESD